MDETDCLLLTFFVIWLTLNVRMQSGYTTVNVVAVTDPTVHNAITRTSSGFSAFEIIMFIFGFPMSVINFLVCGYAWFEFICGCDSGLLSSLCLAFVLLPIPLFATIIPSYGGWILPPIVQKYAWHHRCDAYPMYAILDASAYNSAPFVDNVVYFYEQHTNKWLYTYEVTNPDNDDQWYLRLRDWQTDQAIIPLDEYPTLQSVGYNFVSFDLTGNCTLPASSTTFVGNTTTTTTSCVSGTFDPGNDLFFNITSTVPLNNTANANATAPVTTLLKTEHSGWVSSAGPALIMHKADTETGALGQIVLRTVFENPNDYTQLKVCIAGIEGSGSQVGAEVMAPLGVILMGQSDYVIS